MALFLCNNDTMTECMTRNLFGTNEPYGRGVKNGELCLLYNYSDNSVYGVWEAISDGGTFDATAWRGRYPNQVKIREASKQIISVSRNSIPTLAGDRATIGRIYDGQYAQELLQHFASVYQRHQNTVETGHSLDEDYRNRYPANFFCDNGMKVRSQGEKIICDWLWRHDVKFTYESVTAVPGLIPDFVVFSRRNDPIFIEYWGMTGDDYEKRRLHKSKIYAQFRLPLIELYPHDLQIIDTVLSKKLNHHDVAFRG